LLAAIGHRPKIVQGDPTVRSWYRQRHGNLRTDGLQAALAGALKQGGRSYEALWFGPDPLASVAELAARHGDPDGQGVHFSADSVRYLWLDRAQPERRTTTLGGPQRPTPRPR
jgi:hypothetical protein